MQVSIETTGNLGRRMKVAVPADRFEKAFAARLQQLSRNLKVPGFRPGKVPRKMVEAQYGDRVLREVMGDLIQSTFYEAAKQQGLKPAGGPSIEPNTIERGKDFEYTAEFEVYPELAQIKLPQQAVERPMASIEASDVDRTLETMRNQRRGWERVERAAQDGDRLNIDFVGKINGVAFEGGTAKGYTLVLGSGALIVGFEAGLVGAKVGDTRNVDVTFPADYRNTALAGKPASFDVTVNGIEGPKLPSLDDGFAASLGVPGGTVERLREEVRESLEREAKERAQAKFKQNMFDALMAANALELPSSLVQREAQRLMELTRANLQAQNIPLDKLPKDSTPFTDRARQRVQLGLLLAELVKQYQIRIEPAAIRERLNQMAQSYEKPDEFVQWHYQQPERLAEIESILLEEQVVQALEQKVPVSDKRLSFQELVSL